MIASALVLGLFFFFFGSKISFGGSQTVESANIASNENDETKNISGKQEKG